MFLFFCKNVRMTECVSLGLIFEKVLKRGLGKKIYYEMGDCK